MSAPVAAIPFVISQSAPTTTPQVTTAQRLAAVPQSSSGTVDLLLTSNTTTLSEQLASLNLQNRGQAMSTATMSAQSQHQQRPPPNLMVSASGTRRGSISSPCLPTLGAAPPAGPGAVGSGSIEAINTSFSKKQRPSFGSRPSALALFGRAVGFSQFKIGVSTDKEKRRLQDSTKVVSEIIPKTTMATAVNIDTRKGREVASFLANEILLLIFRHLMDRKSILNCSLVSSHWHGPARVELEKIIQDMPFNGQGLVHAIRARFAGDAFPFLSMALFDKLVCNLSELYYHSNPETKAVFAPANAPDMLYHLFWTFLFIDQEFRNTRSRPKVTCSYFVHLLQNEGGGYPRQYFDKKVLKNMYNDIKARPLLPAPHLIRTFQEVDGSMSNGNSNASVAIDSQEEQTRSRTTGHGAQHPSHHNRQNSLMDLASTIRHESFGRLRRWWRHVLEDADQNQIGWVSHIDTPSSSSHSHQQDTEDSTVAIESSSSSSISFTTSASVLHPLSSDTALPSRSSSTSSSSTIARYQLQPPPSSSLQHSASSTFPQGNIVPTTGFGSTRSRSGAQSDLSLPPAKTLSTSYPTLHPSRNSINNSNSILNQGFTSVSVGWRPQGDGLDEVVRFPKPKRASTLGLEHQVLQYSTLMLEMDTDD